MTTTTPPGTGASFQDAKDIGSFSDDHGGFEKYFKSVFFSRETMSLSGLEDIYYKFQSAGGFLTMKTIEYPAFSSWIEAYRPTNLVNPFINTNGEPNSNRISYQIDAGLTYLTAFSDSADLKPTVAFDLGVIVTPISTSNYVDGDAGGIPYDFGVDPDSRTYTGSVARIYDRILPTDPAAKEMTVSQQTLVDDQSDTFKFEVSHKGQLIIDVGGDHGTVVLHMPAQGNIGMPYDLVIPGGYKIMTVEAGEYSITIWDELTTLVGNGSGGNIRMPGEVVDEYSLRVDFTRTAVLPDFTCDITSLSRTSVPMRGKLSGTFEFHNSGDEVDTVRAGFYVSKDDNITKNDKLFAYFVLEDLDSSGQTWTLDMPSLPKGLRPGKYYFGAIMDYNERVNEQTGYNNATPDPIAFRITRNRSDETRSSNDQHNSALDIDSIASSRHQSSHVDSFDFAL